MLMVVSPAKDLDYQTAAPAVEVTMPALLADSAELMQVCLDPDVGCNFQN